MAMYSSKSSRQLLATTGLPSVDKAANALLNAFQQISEDSDGEDGDDSPRSRRFSNARMGVSSSMPGLLDPHGKKSRTPKARQADSNQNSLPSLPRINQSWKETRSEPSRGERLSSHARVNFQQDSSPERHNGDRLGSKGRMHGATSILSHTQHNSQSASDRKLAHELQALTLVHQKTVEELAHATRQLSWAQSELHKHEEDIDTSRCSRLAADLKSEREEVNRLKAELRADRDKSRNRNGASEELQAELSQLKSVSRRQKDETEELKSELARAKSRKDKMKSELKSMQDHSSSIVEAGEDFFKESQAKLQRSAEELSVLKFALKEARAENAQHEQQLEELSKTASKSDDVENLRQANESMSRQLDEALESLNKLRREQAAAATLRNQELEDLKNLKAQLAEQEIRRKSQDNHRLLAESMRNELIEKSKELEAANEARRQKEKLVQQFNNEKESKKSNQELQEENEVLRDQLYDKKRELSKLEDDQEKSINDYQSFINRIINSSAAPVLQHTLDTNAGELIGMGNYGYVMTCLDKKSKETVVLKLQSVRWLHVAVREWSHCSDIGRHPNIVEAKEVLVHSDVDHSIQKRLAAGFEDGTLTGKRPKWLPNAYLCMVQEYMDRGTIGSLIERHLLTLEGICAVTRQVASALSFLHRKKRTHNDVKPENILLKRAPDGNHMLVKLADMGMAEHSVDRTRDCDLFAYTIWCMVMGKSFSRCPQKDARPDAMGEFQRAAVLGRKATERSTVLIEAVNGLWSDTMDTAAVACRPELEGCEVRDPDCDLMKKRLKDCANEEVVNRANESLQRFRYVARKAANLHKAVQNFAGDEDVQDVCDTSEVMS